jgi:hypothetical protein
MTLCWVPSAAHGSTSTTSGPQAKGVVAEAVGPLEQRQVTLPGLEKFCCTAISSLASSIAALATLNSHQADLIVSRVLSRGRGSEDPETSGQSYLYQSCVRHFPLVDHPRLEQESSPTDYWTIDSGTELKNTTKNQDINKAQKAD